MAEQVTSAKATARTVRIAARKVRLHQLFQKF